MGGLRFLVALLALFGLATAARADDIAAAGRSVVRVVVIAFEDGEVVDFGHGSGFAVASNRIVTNAHVVALAAQQGIDVVIGVVPSEGSQAYRARIVTIDPARDLALVELERGSLVPIGLYVGPLADGTPVTALGYPGNVDLATARSADDYIRPLPPTRSAGIFSNSRSINGISTLLHTANIARGHSGGPLLDACGRVLGVNTLITRNESGDSPFAFAVSNQELTTFLRQANQPFRSTSAECVSMTERLRQDEQRSASQEAARRAAEAEADREAHERALATLDEQREFRLALAVLLLVLALIAFGGGGIMLAKDRRRPGAIAAGAGTLLLIGAIIVFLTRPGLDDLDRIEAEASESAEGEGQEGGEARFAGTNVCELVPDRSRVTISSTDPVPLEWSASGCVNQRTQYAQNDDVWTRILVPGEEQAVSVLEFRPATGEYVVSRYQLDAESMERARQLRQDVDVKSCTSDSEARTILADQLRELGQLLPRLPNERLVYRCRNESRAIGGVSGVVRN